MRIGAISNKFIVSQMRLDGKFHLSDGLHIRDVIRRAPYNHLTIKDVTSDVYCPGIFKRNYVSSGVPFLGGGDIQKQDLSSAKFLNEKTTTNHEELRVEYGWTLVTCGGTIGDAVFATKMHSKCWASQHVMRLVPNSRIKAGMLYSYLASRYGKLLLTTNTYGTVIPTLNAIDIQDLPIPQFPDPFQEKIDYLIQTSASYRDTANETIEKARQLLLNSVGLPGLTRDDYNYFGPSTADRKVSTFTKNVRSFGTISFNAFNYSKRVENSILNRIRSITHASLGSVLDDNQFRTSSAVSVLEVSEGHGIMLINQSDIFDRIVKGKNVVFKEKYRKELLRQGEVLIARIGTLGENETFCRCVYVGEELVGRLVSGAFYRLNTRPGIPSGYLYAWLSSEYGFRLLRSSHYGTKQCYPNPALLVNYPIPIASQSIMTEIDEMIKTAHHLIHLANDNERHAISLVEKEIEKWDYE